MSKITMSESTKKAILDTLKEDISVLSDEALLAKIRNNPNFAISFKEAGEIKIKRVLKG